ncbi:MAG: HD domain-containing phosphohydrolase [Thermodesulfobacteriota bacterium]
MPKILLADDDPVILKYLSILLQKHDYHCLIATNGIEAMEKVATDSPDLVLLDIMMPEMDGLEVCKKLKSDPSTQYIPIIIMTGSTDRELRVKGLSAGANDFLTKPIERLELMVRIKNLLRIKEFEDFLRNYNERLKREVEEKTRQIREGYIDTILRLTMVAEYKDEETASHIRRVGRYCHRMARYLGWSEEDQEAILLASPMHDIGKVGIPLEILLKSSRLTPEEFALVKTHTLIGGDILHGSKSKYLQMAETIALTHHERWDGTGYPSGLREQEIPMAGRIMNIVDQYDALRARRPYKSPLDHEAAVRIIVEGDGRTFPEHFDPNLRKAFIELSPAFKDIFETLEDRRSYLLSGESRDSGEPG